MVILKVRLKIENSEVLMNSSLEFQDQELSLWGVPGAPVKKETVDLQAGKRWSASELSRTQSYHGRWNQNAYVHVNNAEMRKPPQNADCLVYQHQRRLWREIFRRISSPRWSYSEQASGGTMNPPSNWCRNLRKLKPKDRPPKIELLWLFFLLGLPSTSLVRCSRSIRCRSSIGVQDKTAYWTWISYWEIIEILIWNFKLVFWILG